MFVVERGDFALYLLRSFLYGVTVSAAYLPCGFFRILIRKTNKVLSAILMTLFDVCFCLFAAFFAMLLVYSANRGQMRIIAILFFAAGFMLLYMPLCDRVEKAEAKLLDAFSKKILYPVRTFIKKKVLAAKKQIVERINLKKSIKYDKNFEEMLSVRIEKKLLQEAEEMFGNMN